jgi:hypothetical protein
MVSTVPTARTSIYTEPRRVKRPAAAREEFVPRFVINSLLPLLIYDTVPGIGFWGGRAASPVQPLSSGVWTGDYRSQTHWPWGFPQGAPEPELWFHDLLRTDGRPYLPVQTIKNVLGDNSNG